MEKITALGFMILAAKRINLSEDQLQNLVEGMRSELMLTPSQMAMNQFFEFDNQSRALH